MRALLVLGGQEIPFRQWAQAADTIICADKGADYALAQGIMPHVLLGDMDSVSKEAAAELRARGVNIIEHPAEKDKTDGELAVDYAKEAGVDSVQLVCAQGSADHYMGNLGLLVYAKKLSLDAQLETGAMTVYSVEDNITLKGEPGTRVSILPGDGEIVVKQTKGMYYEIKKPLPISCGQTVGLSNSMTGTECTICIEKGIALVFCAGR
jgi:thiamine pyrophosphokinase